MFSVSFYFIHFFTLYQSPSCSLLIFFNAVLSGIDEVLSIHLSGNVLVFEYSNLYHDDRLTYCSGTDRPDGLCCNFSTSNNLTLIIILITNDCDLHSLVLLDLLFYFALAFVL